MDLDDSAGVLALSREWTQSRDERFELMVRAHSRLAFQIAYSVLRNSERAEDAVQDMWLKLYRSRDLDKVEDERAFVARCAWRAAVARAGKRSAGNSLETDIVSGDPSPEALAVEADRNAYIRRLIDGLPRKLRDPLLLSAIQEMTSRQIAATLAIPEGTVRTRLLRAREILRAKLAAALGFAGSVKEKR